MNIAVCIKRVPDSETRVKIAADGKSLDEAGVKFILNPYDEFAVEEALRQREKAGALAAELKDNGFDLILLGKMAIDDYNHQVGPMVAELLDLPCVTTVAHLEIAAGKATAEREIEGGVEVVEFSLPAVLTTDKGLNEPRYPALKGIMAAKKKPLEVKPTTPGPGALDIVSLTLPPERQAGKIVGEGSAAVAELVRLLREEAKVL